MESYLSAEDKARVEIDKMLEAAGWAVQDAREANLAAARGVAVREFILEPPHGRADYLLFVERALRRSAVLRRAILEQAFSGKLVPQDPCEEPASVLLTRIAAARSDDPASRRRRAAAKA
jgi:hypothetical protein